MSTISPPAAHTPTTTPWVVDDDGDFEYFWTFNGVDFPIPRWLAEIVDVPLIVRLEIFLIGLCAGLVVAAVVLLIAFYAAVG